jgi:hypothetical protein
LACPYFVPTSKLEDGGWIHPTRLPLGSGWQGHCSAPGHEGTQPTDQDLHDLCNLGYASRCPRLPADRSCDAVRFSIARDRGLELSLWYVCESAHRPVAHGTLEYDVSHGQWVSSHPDPRIQTMADCYLQTYLLRRNPTPSSETLSRTHS